MQRESVDFPVPQNRVERFIGGLLLLPVLLYGLIVLLLPSLQTIATSFMRVRAFREGEWVGLENYGALLSNAQFGGAFGFTALQIGLRLLIVALVMPLLIWAFRQLGKRGQSAMLWLFALPLALFSPTALVMAWGMHLVNLGNMVLASPNSARFALLGVDAILTFGIVLGLGAVCGALLSQRQHDGQTRTSAAVITVVCGLFAVVALSLQSMTVSKLFTDGGPANATQTLGLLAYRYSFAFMDFGMAASINTMLMLVVAALGVIATVLLIKKDVQIAPVAQRVEPLGGSGQVVALIVLVLLLLLSLYGLGPLLSTMRSTSGLLALFGLPTSASEILPSEDIVRALSLSLIPALLSVLVVQVPFTYLTALAIGLLRPLGNRSEWLLLLLAPWLFMTEFPLTPVFFDRFRQMGLLNTLVVLLPPFLLCIPGVVVLTLFFKGHAPRWQAARERQEPYAFLRLVVLPSLPLLALLALGLLIVQSRAYYWPSVMFDSPKFAVGSVTLRYLYASYFTNPAAITSLIASLGLSLSGVWFILLGLMLALGLRGLHLRAGGEPPREQQLG